MTAAWLIAVAGAVVLIRIGWGGRSRVAALGWVIAVAALVALTLRDGAWGLAVGTVAGMVGALALVGYAGWTPPTRVRRPARLSPPRRWS